MEYKCWCFLYWWYLYPITTKITNRCFPPSLNPRLHNAVVFSVDTDIDMTVLLILSFNSDRNFSKILNRKESKPSMPTSLSTVKLLFRKTILPDYEMIIYTQPIYTRIFGKKFPYKDKESHFRSVQFLTDGCSNKKMTTHPDFWTSITYFKLASKSRTDLLK